MPKLPQIWIITDLNALADMLSVKVVALLRQTEAKRPGSKAGERLVTVSEAAGIKRIRPKTVYAAIADGSLGCERRPGGKGGKTVSLIPMRSLTDWTPPPGKRSLP